MRKLAAFFAVVVLSACATTGSTFGSGIGDRQLEHPPYYAGTVAGVEVPRLVRYPVVYQRGASQAAVFDPSGEPESPIATLLSELNAFVDSILGGTPLATSADRGDMPPNVYFGCDRDAVDDCVQRGDSVLGRRGTTMRLAVERPSPGWIARNAALLDSAGASHALLITLEVGQYWTRQNGLRGDKTVELGTGYVMSLPWLTSLETPVSVLQLTGALIDPEGKAVRIGAEGLLAHRTSLAASALGAQRLIADDDVEQARTQRRSDRPGQPLVWREALCQLFAELTPTRCR
jgi:hypothetical protein